LAFKKVRHHQGEEICELKIKDETGRKQDFFVIMISDFPKLANIIKKKYCSPGKRDRDLDWAI
jgi:hypothetical protein